MPPLLPCHPPLPQPPTKPLLLRGPSPPPVAPWLGIPVPKAPPPSRPSVLSPQHLAVRMVPATATVTATLPWSTDPPRGVSGPQGGGLAPFSLPWSRAGGSVSGSCGVDQTLAILWDETEASCQRACERWGDSCHAFERFVFAPKDHLALNPSRIQAQRRGPQQRSRAPPMHRRGRAHALARCVLVGAPVRHVFPIRGVSCHLRPPVYGRRRGRVESNLKQNLQTGGRAFKKGLLS